MLMRVLLGLGSLILLATVLTGVYQAAQWQRQATVTAEVRSASLRMEEGRRGWLTPKLDVELLIQADGALPVRRTLELPREELGFALTWLDRFVPNSVVPLRQSSSEVYLTSAEARQPLEFALAMALLAGVELCVLTALFRSRRKKSAAWLPFFTLGVLALAIATASAAYRSWQANFWLVTIGQRMEATIPPARLEGIVASGGARQRLAQEVVAWTEIEHGGKRVRLPASACGAATECVLLINPYDPEDWTSPFDGDSDAWTPAWIGLFFGIAFTGAGWFVRKTAI